MHARMYLSAIILLFLIALLATGVSAMGSVDASALPAVGQRVDSGSGAALTAPQLISDTVSYRRTVVVSPGDSPEASGTALLKAMDSIADASSAKPYLVKIEPGVYNLGVGALRMKPFVDVEGSGEQATVVTSGGSGVARVGTVMGANNAELRFLTVQNSGGNLQYATAIYNNATSPAITHVTAYALGAIENYGIANFAAAAPTMTDVKVTAVGARNVNNVVEEGSDSIAIYNYGSSPLMTNVIATATGTSNNLGVFNLFSASPVMVNVTASASGSNIRNTGVYNYTECNPTIRNSMLTASGGEGVNVALRNDLSSPVVSGSIMNASGKKSSGIENISVGVLKLNNSQVLGETNSVRNDTRYNTFIAASLLDGGPIINDGKMTCAGIYDASYTFFAGPACAALPAK